MPFDTMQVHDFLNSARTTGQTVLDSDGKLKWALHNYLRDSSNVGSQNWTLSDATIHVSQVLAPDGSGSVVVPEVNVGNYTGVRDANYPFKDGITYMFKIVVRPVGYAVMQFTLIGGVGRLAVDVITGSFEHYSNSGIGDPQVTALPNGFYEVSFSVLSTSGNTTPYMGCAPALGDPAGMVASDGVSGMQMAMPRVYRCDLAGMQTCPNGSDYVATSGSSVFHVGRSYSGQGQCMGLQVYGASTNRLLSSGDVANGSYWGISGASLAASEVEGPTGDTPVIMSATGVSGSPKYVTQTPASSINAAKSISFLVKRGTHHIVQILETSTALMYANFDLLNGVVGAVGTGSIAQIVAVGDGWYWCHVSADIPSANAVRLYMVDTIDAGFAAASVTTGTISIAAAQLEAGLTPTPYIPTKDVAVSRGKDLISLNADEFEYHPAEGTLVAEFQAGTDDTSASQNYIVSLNDMTGDHRMAAYRDGASGYLYLRSAGVDQGQVQGSATLNTG